jgi:hypothetical protein
MSFVSAEGQCQPSLLIPYLHIHMRRRIRVIYIYMRRSTCHLCRLKASANPLLSYHTCIYICIYIHTYPSIYIHVSMYVYAQVYITCSESHAKGDDCTYPSDSDLSAASTVTVCRKAQNCSLSTTFCGTWWMHTDTRARARTHTHTHKHAHTNTHVTMRCWPTARCRLP